MNIFAIFNTFQLHKQFATWAVVVVQLVERSLPIPEISVVRIQFFTINFIKKCIEKTLVVIRTEVAAFQNLWENEMSRHLKGGTFNPTNDILFADDNDDNNNNNRSIFIMTFVQTILTH